MKNKISKLLKEFYPQLNVRIIFKPKNTIQRLFKFKDPVPLKLQSSVVYKYTCHCCKAMYYGQTKRHLFVRIYEHLGKSLRTGSRINNPPNSSIRDHCRTSNHKIKLESFKIMANTSEMELGIIESLFIHRDKPNLNNNAQSISLLCF